MYRQYISNVISKHTLGKLTEIVKLNLEIITRFRVEPNPCHGFIGSAGELDFAYHSILQIGRQGSETGSGHFSLGDQSSGAVLVRLGPIRLGPARREARGISFHVHRLFGVIDPAKAERLLNRLHVIDGRFLCSFLKLDQPNLLLGVMILLQPLAEVITMGHIKRFTDFHTIFSVIARSTATKQSPHDGRNEIGSTEQHWLADDSGATKAPLAMRGDMQGA